jgi:hypothetical protein
MLPDSFKDRNEEMFTKIELNTTLQMIRSQKLSLHQPLTIQSSSDTRSEADLFFFRGATRHYKDGTHFWLRCLAWLEERRKGFQLLMARRYPGHIRVNIDATLLGDRYVDYYSLCQNLSAESFQETMKGYSLGLKNASIPHIYEWEGQIQQAMQMSDEWNDQSFVAETEREFLAFFWETGA